MSELSIMGANEMQTTDPRELPNAAIVLGPRHNPTGHRDSVTAMADAIERSGLTILDQLHTVDGVRNMTRSGGNYGDVTIPGANVFSLFKVSHPTLVIPGSDLMIGYRNSVAQAMAAQACIGRNVTICTNLELFGTDVIFRRKNTTFADLAQTMRAEVCDRVFPMLATVQEQVEKLRAVKLTRVQREATAFRMFEAKALAPKYLAPMANIMSACPEVLETEYPEVLADFDNALGVMSTATRVIQAEKSMRRQAELSQSVSRFFKFGAAPTA